MRYELKIRVVVDHERRRRSYERRIVSERPRFHAVGTWLKIDGSDDTLEAAFESGPAEGLRVRALGGYPVGQEQARLMIGRIQSPELKFNFDGDTGSFWRSGANANKF